MGKQFIGNINLITLRDFILDNKLTDRDTIILNPTNFDDIIIEHKFTYKESPLEPYKLLEVLITEDIKNEIEIDTFEVRKNSRPGPTIYLNEIDKEASIDGYDLDITIYRCGFCGNVVDFDGTEFDPTTRSKKIQMLQKYKDIITVEKIHGKCCPNGIKTYN